MARVIAVERGHDGRVMREPGERFDVPDARLKDGSTWFVEESKAPAPAVKPKSKIPPGAGPIKGSAVKDGEPDPTEGVI
jgi:hypothetical protein